MMERVDKNTAGVLIRGLRSMEKASSCYKKGRHRYKRNANGRTVKSGKTLLYGVKWWMHTTGMLMRGHRIIEGLSYISERLDTNTRGGRQVTRNEKALLQGGMS